VAARKEFILGVGDEAMNELVERYYERNPPKPFRISNLGFMRYDEQPEVGGGPQAVFSVSSPDWSFAIPVMLQETGEGFKLDWIAFNEFKDDALLAFTEARYTSRSALFHVSIKRGLYFDHDVPDLDNKLCYYLQPPLGRFEVAVFVPKGSLLAERLAAAILWSVRQMHVLAEIRWKKEGESAWLELTDVPQFNWFISPEPPARRYQPEASP
jgi:hypothetical protein